MSDYKRRLLDRLPSATEFDYSGWEPFDPSDSRSLINIIPRELRAALEAVPKEWLLLTEEELHGFVSPEPGLNRLRLAFWAEYEAAQRSVRRMDLYAISQLTGRPSKYIVAELRGTDRMAWVLCPPASYEMFLDEALSFGMKRLREDILGMNIKDADGSVDPKKADILLKAIAFVDMRKHGGIVQKNLHLHGSTNGMKALSRQLSEEEIDARIAELEGDGTVKNAQAALPEGTLPDISKLTPKISEPIEASFVSVTKEESE